VRAIVTVRDRLAADDTTVLVDAEPSTPLADVVDAVRVLLGDGPATDRADSPAPSPTFAASGLIDGAVLHIGAPPRREWPAAGIAQLRFVAGPGAGRLGRLTVGETRLGLDAAGEAAFGHDVLGEPHGWVVVAIDGTVTVRANGERPQLTLENGALDEAGSQWRPFAQLELGSSTIEAHPVALSDADLMAAPESGWLDFNRPPRLLPPVPADTFRRPAPPAAPARNAMPWITAMIPALMGVAMAVMLKQPFYLMFAFMSPVMMVGSWLSSRRNGKQSHRTMMAKWRSDLADIDSSIESAVGAEQHRRRTDAPDAAALLLAATAPTRRLWERRPSDPDHLLVRFGTADLPSSVGVEEQAELEHRRHSTGITRGVPVTLSLAAAGVIGIAGSGTWARQACRWLVGQLAVLQSPRDLQVYVLCAPDAGNDWNWVNWLPHARPALGQDALSLTATDAETLGRRVAELGQLVAERTESSRSSTRRTVFTPDVLVVLDGARRLRAMPGIVALLRDGADVGVHVVCLDDEERQLPEECTAVVVRSGEDELVVKRQSADDIEHVTTDRIDAGWFEEVGRSLAPIHDVTVSDADGLLPHTARLLDAIGLREPTGEAVAARWRLEGRSTRATIGISLDGPFAIDLVRDGPHGLVAGTTGAGKSEFLQTLVASLAVANRPDEMTFVLVDYKGGAAFSGCVDLPHTVGMVTDLDSHLVQRALGSLRAELVRREHILALAGAKDLEGYHSHLGRGGAGETLPRLAIVIDEFAAMAKELPDFVAGLIGIAQRGRSLGVHLVMATQRPSGVISPEIRANTNLRIALRMTDVGESSDVIDIPDAARISKATPGRAYARLGHASIIPFQTARVGGASPVAAEEAPTRPPFVQALTWAQFSLPAPVPPWRATASTATTDLSVLVDSVRAASVLLDIPRQHSPWLPPLADSLSLGALVADGDGFAWGLEDIPSRQVQQNAAIDLDRFGHLYIVGAPGSGRSQALRTIAASAAAASGLSDMHLYGIDCGNGALASLAALPHCGAITQRSQSERSTRLLDRLEAEVLRRHDLLGAGNFANIAEQRRAGVDALPHILLLIDRWDNFASTLGEVDNGRLTEVVQSLLRDGASAGIHLVIAGDRSLLTSRMAVLCDDKLILRLTDRLDYSLADLNHKTIPLEIGAGRGFRAGSGIEVQVAMLGLDPAGPAQSDAVRRLGAELTDREQHAAAEDRPFRVDDLPSTLDLDEAFAFSIDGDEHTPMWAMVGVGGDRLVAHGINLERESPTFVVAGPARSGRSTLLAVMAHSLLRTGTEVVLVCPRPSPLRELAGLPGVRALLTSADLTEEQLAPLLDPDGTPVVLIIDDGELVMDAPAKTWLRGYVRTAGDVRRGLILGGNAAEICAGFSGWQVDLKKNRRGALLSPQSTVDGDLLGVRVARSMISPRVTPGRALVHLGSGDLITLQVPVSGVTRVAPAVLPPPVSARSLRTPLPDVELENNNV
jgi:S-DNA-T family DNA segregation ATPase FtsK/SpoIIIE